MSAASAIRCAFPSFLQEQTQIRAAVCQQLRGQGNQIHGIIFLNITHGLPPMDDRQSVTKSRETSAFAKVQALAGSFIHV